MLMMLSSGRVIPDWGNFQAGFHPSVLQGAVARFLMRWTCTRLCFSGSFRKLSGTKTRNVRLTFMSNNPAEAKCSAAALLLLLALLFSETRVQKLKTTDRVAPCTSAWLNRNWICRCGRTVSCPNDSDLAQRDSFMQQPSDFDRSSRLHLNPHVSQPEAAASRFVSNNRPSARV